MKNLISVRLFIASSLLITLFMRCDCGKKVPNSRLTYSAFEPEHNESLDSLTDILQAIKTEANICGFFIPENDISVGEIFSKTDKEGGTYTYSVKEYNKDGDDIDLNYWVNKVIRLKNGDKVLVHNFHQYAGDFKRMRGYGPIIKITGAIVGTNWNKEKGTMRIDARLQLVTIGLHKNSDKTYIKGADRYESEDGKNLEKILFNTPLEIKNLGIDNGPDGKKAGTLESLVKLSKSKSHKEFFIPSVLNIDINTKYDPEYKDWLKNLINCEKIADQSDELEKDFASDGHTEKSVDALSKEH